MKFTILYSGRSSKTGKDLLNKFKPRSSKAFRKRTDKRLNTDVILRWGSTENFSRLRGRLELNSLESVKNASDKYKMMKILTESGIPTCEVLFDPFGFTYELNDILDRFRDENGGFFIRGANHQVRYDDTVKTGDLYLTKPLENKRREYRVHVFNGEVIAIYEKIPNDESVKMFKSHNCSFKLRNIENCRLTKENQETCIKAVNSLGLLFGGIDLMRDKDQNIFISEVNSAPALNSTNIDRYVEKITEYCQAMGV
jgi:glutathione synthase/RimK-type ligase-like ATP-grasp enzyme